MVSGSGVGGVFGYDNSHNTTNVYFDTDTSGLSASQGSGSNANDNGITGLTTAQLQSGLPTGFAATTWAIQDGSYPYLQWQAANGPLQVVSGIVSDANGGAVGGAAITVTTGGGGDTVSSGANGYYYDLVSATPGATLASGTGKTGASFTDTGVTTGLDITADTLTEHTGAQLYSTTFDALSDLQHGAGIKLAGLDNLTLDLLGDYNIDQAIHLGGGTLAIHAAGGSVNQNVGLTANKLLLTGNANFTFGSANQFNIIAADTTQSLFISSNHLTVGTVDGVAGVYSGGGMELEANAGDLLINQALTADNHPMTLYANGAITESGAGVVTTSSLSGSAYGSIKLNAASNQIGVLDTLVSSNTLSLVNNAALTLTGLDVGQNGISITTLGTGHGITIKHMVGTNGLARLVSAAGISESGSGKIFAAALSGSSALDTMLSGNNQIFNLGYFTSKKSLMLNDDVSLNVGAPVKASINGHITLTTNGSAHDIDIYSTIRTGTLRLNSSGEITEVGQGHVVADTLTGDAGKTVVLAASNNRIGALGSFTAGGDFILGDGKNLRVTGAVSTAANHELTLGALGSGADLEIKNDLTTGTLTLDSSGTILQSAGMISAAVLMGQSSGDVALNGPGNTIASLGAFNTGNGDLSLSTDSQLLVTGAVNAGTGTLSLTTQGAGHRLGINADVTAATVNLVSSGNVTESPNGAITTNLINVTADSGITLTRPANQIGAIGTDQTNTGPDQIN